MYNFNDEEEEEDGPTKEKAEENELLKEKMKQIRLKMEKLNISKKVGNWALYHQIVICVSLVLYIRCVVLKYCVVQSFQFP